MSAELKGLLEATAVGPTAPLDVTAVLRRGKRRRQRNRLVASSLAIAVALAVLLGSGRFIDPGPDKQVEFRPAEQPSRSQTSVFAAATDTVLLFDGNASGVVAVDLDVGTVARRVLTGQRAGDPHYGLWRTGDALVIGWGDIYGVSLDTATSRLLGEATIFVPAAEPDSVWLIDYSDGRIGQGTPTYSLVSLDGEIRSESPGIDLPGYSPAIGVLGGLAMETSEGLAVWDATTQEIVSRFGTGSAFVADALGRRVVWCEDLCARLRVTDLGGEHQVFSPPLPYRFFEARSARLSPDGKWVAAVVGAGADQDRAVVLVDTETGEVVPVTPSLAQPPAYLAWSSDGSQLFFSTYTYSGPKVNIGRYVPQSGKLDLAVLPFGGTFSFVALDREEAGEFLTDAIPVRSLAR